MRRLIAILLLVCTAFACGDDDSEQVAQCEAACEERVDDVCYPRNINCRVECARNETYEACPGQSPDSCEKVCDDHRRVFCPDVDTEECATACRIAVARCNMSDTCDPQAETFEEYVCQ